jgi:hypothetical protein
VGVVDGKAARTEQTLSTLRLACELARMVFDTFSTHDLRRGLTRDIAYIPKASRLNTREAAEALHHSDKSVRQGVTSEYISPNARNVWLARLEHTSAIPKPKRIDALSVSFKRRKYTSLDDLKKACIENSLDYTKRGDRDRVRKIIRKQDMSQLIERHELLDSEPQASHSYNLNSGMLSQLIATEHTANRLTALAEKSSNIISHKRKATVHELDDFDNGLIDPQLLLSTATMEKLDVFRYTGNLGHTSQEHSSIGPVHNPSLHQMSAAVEPHDESMDPDPRDNEQLAQLAGIIHGAVPSEEMEAIMDPLFENEDKCDNLKLFTEVSSLEFIKKMSQINIVCHQSVALHTVTGGSRDEPSRFLYSYPNAVHGCEKVMETTEQVRVHIIYCKSTSPEAHAIEQRRADTLNAKKT